MRGIRYAWIAAAAAMLAGCASPASLGAPPDVRESWMAPEAKSQPLLYISDVGTNDVYAYSYPGGKLEGTLTGFYSPVRECSDTSGNVYITNTNLEEVLEYAHGGTHPIATYHDKGWLPVDCSVDPTTGTLAVTNYGPTGSNTGSLAVYPNGKGPAKIYQAPNVQAYLFCAYDGSGNLFIDSLDYSYDLVFIELPKGATTFKNIALGQSFAAWGGVQWDGKYIAIGDGSSAIYDFAIKGTKGTKVKSIQLKGAVNVVQFWIDGSTVIGPDGPNGAKRDVGFWSYPAGGLPTKRLHGSFKNPSSATISVAP